MSSIGNIASGLLHAILPSGLFPNNTTAANLPAATSPVTQPPDIGQLSSFAQLAATLQQLQQSNPAQYQQVTRQIGTNLQSAARTAQSSGNAGAATQLDQLAADFTNASASGQLPNLQDLAKAVGGHHASRATHVTGLSQLLASLQTSGTQSGATSATAIIENTLTSAGISP